MDKFCEKCGAPLNEDGICPNCAAEPTQPDTKTEPTPAPAEPSESAKPAESEQTAEQTAAVPAEDDSRSSKFALTAKQVWTVIKGFFTKNAVDTIAAQYNDSVPIWGILLPAYALLAAISATATYRSSGSYSNEITAMLNQVDMGSGEVFFLTLAYGLISMFTLALAVRFFIKLHKGDGHFNMSANLVCAAQLPNMLIFAFNTVTGGAVSGIISAVSALATCAVYMLIFAGISKALGGKKPIWSFFLMLICYATIAIVVTVFVASPIIFSRVAYSVMDSFKGLS